MLLGVGCGDAAAAGIIRQGTSSFAVTVVCAHPGDDRPIRAVISNGLADYGKPDTGVVSKFGRAGAG